MNSIKPQKSGESDKYSWNIYAHLYKYRKLRCKIIARPDHQWNPSDIYIVYHTNGDVLGRMLREIMNGAIDIQDFSHRHFDNFIDITYEFFHEYQRKGRCLFFPEHTEWIMGYQDRFQHINKNSKRCLWCGEVLRRVIVTRKTIHRDELWLTEGNKVDIIRHSLEGEVKTASSKL